MIYKAGLEKAENEIKISNVNISYIQPCDGTKNNILYVSREFVESHKLTLEFDVSVLFALDNYRGEKCTRDFWGKLEKRFFHLDEDGFPPVGSELQPGEILVGMVAPTAKYNLSSEERLLKAIFGDKASAMDNISLTVPNYLKGIVGAVEKNKNKKGEVEDGKITLRIRLPLSVGDVLESENGTRAIVAEITDLTKGVDIVSTTSLFYGTLTRKLLDTAKWKLEVNYQFERNHGEPFFQDSVNLNGEEIKKIIDAGFWNELQNAIKTSEKPIDEDIRKTISKNEVPEYPIYNAIFTKQLLAYFLALGVKFDFYTEDSVEQPTVNLDESINHLWLRYNIQAVTDEYISSLGLMQVESEEIYDNRNAFSRLGLFSEEVFGQLREGVCKCERKYSLFFYVGERCKKCGALIKNSTIPYTGCAGFTVSLPFLNPIFPKIYLNQVIILPTILRPAEYMSWDQKWDIHPLNLRYRSVITRSKRCDRLQELDAGEILIRNEKVQVKKSINDLYYSEDGLFSCFYDFVAQRFRKLFLTYSARLKPVINTSLKDGVCKMPKAVIIGVFADKRSDAIDFIKKQDAYILAVSSSKFGKALSLKVSIGEYDAIELSDNDYHRLGISDSDCRVAVFRSPMDIDQNAIQSSPVLEEDDKKRLFEFMDYLFQDPEIDQEEKRRRVLSWINYIKEVPKFINSLIFCYLTGRTPY